MLTRIYVDLGQQIAEIKTTFHKGLI